MPNATCSALPPCWKNDACALAANAASSTERLVETIMIDVERLDVEKRWDGRKAVLAASKHWNLKARLSPVSPLGHRITAVRNPLPPDSRPPCHRHRVDARRTLCDRNAQEPATLMHVWKHRLGSPQPATARFWVRCPIEDSNLEHSFQPLAPSQQPHSSKCSY